MEAYERFIGYENVLQSALKLSDLHQTIADNPSMNKEGNIIFLIYLLLNVIIISLDVFFVESELINPLPLFTN